MSNAIDSALAFITSSYSNPSPSVQAEIVKVVIKAGKVQRVKDPKGTALPNVQGETKVTPSPNGAKAKAVTSATDPAVASKPAMIKAPLPPKGTYDARGFLKAWRTAKSRDEQIASIAGYCGYDAALNLGEQEFSARSAAQREIRGAVSAEGPTRAEHRTAQRSVAGFVAGMPDGDQRAMGDLLAREKLSVDTLASFSKESTDPSKTEAERTNAEGRILIEEERLIQIRKDLAKYL